MAQLERRKSTTVKVGNVRVGSSAPVVVQSMTNTDTADVQGTIQQVAALANAGSELVRVTVNNDAAAAALPAIVEGLAKLGIDVPIVGDFHYNGHLLLKKYPECARALAKYRINPGNVSIGRKDDDNFRTMIECAVENQKPVRIGVNWGSLDQALLTKMMDENSKRAQPAEARDVMIEAMLVSAIESARAAERYGLRHDQIILSAKVSGVRDLIEVYELMAARCDYALHLGLTEAGMSMKGIVASTAGLAPLLLKGHRRHHTRLPDPQARGRSHRGSAGGATDPAISGHPQFCSPGDGLPGMRPHQQHLFSGVDPGYSGLRTRQHAGMARALSRGRRAEAGGDGLRGERTGRVQARQHRHFASRHL